MTLKIEKVSDGRKRIIRLNSRLRSEHLDELKTLIKGDQSRIALDLDGVTLVDVEVVRFLNACEEKGHEPPYRVFRRYGADARRRWGNCPHRQPSQLKKGYVTMMTRRMFSTSILAGVAAALLPAAARSQTSVKARNVVLVHGAYADGSSWLEVIPYLQAAGMKATAVQNPLSSLADDVAATKRILALQDGPTVLVGHSWAGTMISEAGVDPKVSALVYVAARAPDAGEDYGALAAKFPKPPASAGLVESDGYAQLDEEAFVKYFAGDIDPVKARALYAVQGRISSTLFASRTTVAAWKSKPTFYAISKQDKTTSPELERFLADRMKAKTIEVDASHVSLISKPKEIADLILLAAGNGA